MDSGSRLTGSAAHGHHAGEDAQDGAHGPVVDEGLEGIGRGAPRLTASSWKNPVSANWSTAADWTAGAVPGSQTDATIAVAGNYTVTIATAAVADSLVLNNATAKVMDNAVFTVGGPITLSAGTFTLNGGGMLAGGTLAIAGGIFLSSGGTLSGVAVQGTLGLGAASSSLYLTGANSFAGAGGTGAGVINLTGSSANLYAQDNTTLNNATVTIGNSAGQDNIRLYSNVLASDTLTLGSGLNLVQSGANSQAQIDLWDYTNTAGTLINQGTITASGNHGRLVVYGGPTSAYGTFTNTGSIAVSNADTLSLEVGLTTAGLGRFSTATAGVVRLENGYTLTNTGATLTLSTAAQLTLAGQITGGTIADGGGGLIAAGGTLSGVAYQGTLGLTASSTQLFVTGTNSFTGAGGTGLGTINLTGVAGNIYAEDNTTIDNATLNIGNANTDVIYVYPNLTTSDTLTLGPHLNLVHSVAGSLARIDLTSYGAAGVFVNQGTITASANGGTLTVYDGTSMVAFTNSGTIAVSNHDTVVIETNLTTAGLGVFSTVTGGALRIDSATTLFNAGAVLNVGTATQLTLGSGGEILGGTVVDSGSGIVASGGTLGGVTYQGTLNLAASSAGLEIDGGINASAGGGAGVINVTGANATLSLGGTETIDNATINLGNSAGSNVNLNGLGNGAPAALTFGSHLSIVASSRYGSVINYDAQGYGITTLLNNGTITSGVNAGTIQIVGCNGGDQFTNAGTLIASGGGISVNSVGFTNTGTLIASGGGVITLAGSITTAGLGAFSTSGLGAVDLAGTLSNNGAILTLGTADQLTLAGGLINGGTIVDGGSGLIATGGTLNAVAYQGTLSLAAGGASLTIAGGLNVSTGGGAGIVNVTGNSAYLYLDDTQTLDNATIDLGGASGTDFLYGTRDVAGAQTLTLGTHLSIVQTGRSAIFYYDSSGNTNGDALVNNGTITAGVSGGTFTVDDYYNTGSFVNHGTLIATNGATLDLQNANVAAGGLGAFSTSGGGVLLFDSGSGLTNTGAVLTLGTADVLTLAGTINGGTIADAGGGLVAGGGLLSNLTYQGTLGIGASLSLYVTSIAVTTGGSTGVITLASNAGLYLQNTQTLDNATVTLGAGAYLYGSETTGHAGTFTLGSHLSIVEGAAGAVLYLDTNGIGAGWVNNGTITAGVSASALSIYAPYSGDTLTNNGSLIATNAGTISMTQGVLKNFGAATLTGGYFEADARSVLDLAATGVVGTDAATIVLSGAGSVVEFYNTSTGTQGTLDTTLATIAATGTLELLAGRGFTGAKAFTDSGLLQLGGGSFSETSLSVGSGGRILGFGTVAPAIANSGTLEARGGTLLINGGVSGTGLLQIDAGATLELHSSTTASQTASFAGQGTLKLDNTAAFASPIANLLGGDVVNVGSLVATGAVINGSTLAITLSGGTVLNETLTGQYSAERVGVSADGHSITAYRYAIASLHTPEPVAFGNHHVGDTVSTTLALTNTAVADGYSEALDASLGSASAGITASGSFTGLVAGQTNGSSLVVGLNTGSAGAVSGSASIALSTDGVGTDGGAALLIGTQAVNVTGAAYAYAQGTAANGGIVTLANTHVGQAASGTLALTNSAAANGYSEALDASLATTLPGFTASGTVSFLAAGATDSTNLLVGATASAGGQYSGTATLGLVSDGGSIDGLGTTALVSQTILITGAAYAYAVGQVGAPTLSGGTITLGNFHVGSGLSEGLILTNAAAANGYSEALDASFGSFTGGITGVGTLTGLAAGSNDGPAPHLAVIASTNTAGVITGTAQVILVSDGSGIDGLGTTALGSQTVGVTGTAYALAVGQVGTTSLNLGVTHVGSTASGAVSVTNAAAANGYSEALDASLSGGSGGVVASGTVTGIAAGATSSALSVGLQSGSSGVFSGSAVLGLTSDGAGIDGLGTTVLGGQTLSVTGTFDNYAVAAFTDTTGQAIVGSGTAYTVNLGRVAEGSAALTLTLGATNAATGLADLLQGTLTTSGGSGFTNAGFGSFSGLAAGQSETAQTVTLATGGAGTFTETVVLTSAGTNASSYIGALPTETLTITGTILAPGTMTTYVLAVGTNAIAGADGGDLFQAVSGAINSHDSLSGGVGANSLQLIGGGLFDIGAPASFANIPTITALEGQAAKASAYDTRQTVFMRNGVAETLIVTAGTAASGNTNVEAITVYDGTGNDGFVLAAGQDVLYLGTGSASVTLGGAANSVTAGGGVAAIKGTAAVAGAAIVGAAAGSTSLEITNAGTVVLNAADKYLTVRLDAATKLTIGSGGFITAVGSTGADTLTAGGAMQTLTGGLGADSLTGAAVFGDSFVDSSAGLNGDSITKFGGSDVIDVTDLNYGALTDSYSGNATKGTLTLKDGVHTAAITLNGSYALTNFTFASDTHGGTVIGFH